ncbi:glucan biosynthesis protein C [Novosphingobium chloroacetimidivorans]|uniref:Glucan biosynthesis protein C n=1 Tax=Novosphingobium chloroacetimidivorans TaxID=1428314 RepID=A0A7W7NWW7_9SPHN|nr:acyltransferase family protein [Novosphingobium chloroacetimidivorans]MBB4858532.1 glucan biosynthesis protein C [Novosphingobium chloroacetimidivorans]
MTTQSQREHFWDALRAFLMLLGIPYHVALSYQPGQDFIVHSGEGVRGFSELAEGLHLFRMPAFFVVAGYFAMLLLARREPMAWLRGRFVRLGLPFLTCIVTLVPAMNLVCELSNLPAQEALRSWRENSLTSGGYWVRHLWFIVVLLYLSSATALLARRVPRLRSGFLPHAIDSWAARHFVLTLGGLGLLVGLWEAFALEAFYRIGLATMVPQQILRLDETIIYLPWFTLGCVLGRARSFRERTMRVSLPVVLVAIAGTALWLAVHKEVTPMTERFIGTIAALATTLVLIAVARTLLDRPIVLVRRLTDASFVIYLFHLPLIALFVWLAQPLPVPPLAKAMAIMALSFGASYAIWLGIGRMRAMSLLFEGLTVPRRAPLAT